jgi:hypothetical protein
LVSVYTPELLARPHAGASESARPVFVGGMPPSGTSLVEQIIALHPAAHGAGELEFWTDVVRKHEEGAIRKEPPSESHSPETGLGLPGRARTALEGCDADRRQGTRELRLPGAHPLRVP